MRKLLSIEILVDLSRNFNRELFLGKVIITALLPCPWEKSVRDGEWALGDWPHSVGNGVLAEPDLFEVLRPSAHGGIL
jgi:hypothetical protein